MCIGSDVSIETFPNKVKESIRSERREGAQRCVHCDGVLIGEDCHACGVVIVDIEKWCDRTVWCDSDVWCDVW